MTDLTDDQVRALLAHYDLPTDCDCDGDDCVKCCHYPTFQERAAKKLKELAPDLARALLQARADAAAAQVLMVEQAVEAIKGLWRWDDEGWLVERPDMKQTEAAIRDLAPDRSKDQ